MSYDRVPVGEKKLLLIMFKKGDIATVTAIWDEPEIIRLFTLESCVKLYQEKTFGVFAKMGKGSQKIDRELALYIAGRWLKGQYIKVRSELFGDWESMDSIR